MPTEALPRATPRIVAAMMAILLLAAFLVTAPPAAAAIDNPSLPIQVGDRGSDVATVQALLAAAGHDPGPADGIFGPMTQQAVASFQTEHGLSATGIVDQATWDALNGGVVIQRGDRGDQVRILQQLLAGAGFSPGVIDGIFGSLTQQAVSQYQAANGLAVTGVVDDAMWSLLGADPSVPEILYQRGDSGDDVRALQLMLATAGANPGPLDGIFGGKTEAAVSQFQAANSLPVTGTVDQATWDLLSSAPPAPASVLQKGDRGPEVESFQTLLDTVGFDPGPIDGIFGSKTELAVSRFQSVHGLAGAGTATQETLDLLAVLEPQALSAYDYGYVPGSGVEQWRPLVTQVFALWGLDQTACGVGGQASKCIGPQIDHALIIMNCESGGRPNAVNYASGTTGLFQHRPGFWDVRTSRVRDIFPEFALDATPYNPEHNIMVAALLVWESREALLGNNTFTGPWDDGPEPWGHWDSSSRYCADPPLVTP